MPVIDLDAHSDFFDWQPLARHMLLSEIHPDEISWCASQVQDLFANGSEALSAQCLADEDTRRQPLKISRRFIELARFVASHTRQDRFDLLYRLLWRLTHGEPQLVANALDPQVRAANAMARQVSRDRHKMRAFVRFRELRLRDVNAGTVGASTGVGKEERIYMAWFEPEHYILRLNANFFCRRFHTMDWSIVTPYQSLHWRNRELHLGNGADPSQLPQEDAMEEYWRCYYANIFNPARLKINAMCREMPKKYWHNLPEAELIQGLIDNASDRTQAMLQTPSHRQGKLSITTRFNRERWLKSKGR